MPVWLALSLKKSPSGSLMSFSRSFRERDLSTPFLVRTLRKTGYSTWSSSGLVSPVRRKRFCLTWTVPLLSFSVTEMTGKPTFLVQVLMMSCTGWPLAALNASHKSPVCVLPYECFLRYWRTPSRKVSSPMWVEIMRRTQEPLE